MINFEDVLSKEMQWSALEILESPAKIKSVVQNLRFRILMTSFAEVAKASLKHCCDSEDDDTTQDLPVPLLKHQHASTYQLESEEGSDEESVDQTAAPSVYVTSDPEDEETKTDFVYKCKGCEEETYYSNAMMVNNHPQEFMCLTDKCLEERVRDYLTKISEQQQQ